MSTYPDHNDKIKDVTHPYDQRAMKIIAIFEGKIAAQRLELDELLETVRIQRNIMSTQKLEAETTNPSPEPLAHFAYRGKKLPSDRASITLTLTKTQKRKWSELGGTEWLRRVLTAAVHADKEAK